MFNVVVRALQEELDRFCDAMGIALVPRLSALVLKGILVGLGSEPARTDCLFAIRSCVNLRSSKGLSMRFLSSH